MSSITKNLHTYMHVLVPLPYFVRHCENPIIIFIIAYQSSPTSNFPPSKKKKGKKRRRKEEKRTNQQPIKQASEAKQNGSSNGISGGNVPGGSAERYTRSVLDVENNYSTARSARSEKRSPLDPGSFHGLAFAV